MRIVLFFFTGLMTVSWSVWCVPALAQVVRYGYDPSGNRVVRGHVIHMPSQPARTPGGTEPVPIAATDPLEETVDAFKVTIYPNPTQGVLRVALSGKDIPPGARIFLYNLSGGMVRQWDSVSGMNVVDISEQPAGTYLMRIVPDRKTSSVWRIVKE